MILLILTILVLAALIMVKDLSISLISLLILLILSSVLIRYIKFWRRQYLDSEQEIHDLDRVDSL